MIRIKVTTTLLTPCAITYDRLIIRERVTSKTIYMLFTLCDLDIFRFP